MRSQKPRKRTAWLITWESSRRDYLADLNRPRVVAILKPQISSSTIRQLLPVLFISESKLTFSEKIAYSFFRRHVRWLRDDLRRICCGDNPWLEARLVKELYVETYPDTSCREKLHWTEHPRHSLTPSDTDPERHCLEDTKFDMLWYGRGGKGGMQQMLTDLH